MAQQTTTPAAAGRNRLTIRSLGGLWYIALLVLVFLLGCFDMLSIDIWWHLKTGQLIWQRGHVPRTDWFTFTNPDAPWIDLHWAFQLLCAGLWALGGVPALILAKCLVGTATIAVALTAGPRGEPRWRVVGCWLVPVLLFAARYYVRPEMMTALLLACTLSVLYHAPKRPQLLWLLPAIQLAWVNVQGLFVLQLVVLVCFLAEALVKQLLSAGPATARWAEARLPLRLLFGASAATVAASLANPYGLKGALFPATLFARVRGAEREFYHHFSAELKGLDTLIHDYGAFGVLTSPNVLLWFALLGVGLLTFVLLALRGRMSLYRLLVFLAFGYLTWQMFRNVVLFGLVAGVVLRLNVADLQRGGDGAERAARRKRTGRNASARKGQRASSIAAAAGGTAGWVPPVVAACLGLLIISVPTGWYFDLVFNRPNQTKRCFGLGESPIQCHRAAQFLARPGMPRYVYAMDTGAAAVCIFHLAPEKRVFADPRLETNTRQTLYRYYEIGYQLASGDPKAEENLTRDIPPDERGRRELPVLLLDNRTIYFNSLRPPRLLPQLLRSPRWRCVWFDAREPKDWWDAASVLDGTTIFLETQRAEKLGLPAVSTELLNRVIIDTLKTGRMR